MTSVFTIETNSLTWTTLSAATAPTLKASTLSLFFPLSVVYPIPCPNIYESKWLYPGGGYNIEPAWNNRPPKTKHPLTNQERQSKKRYANYTDIVSITNSTKHFCFPKVERILFCLSFEKLRAIIHHHSGNIITIFSFKHTNVKFYFYFKSIALIQSCIRHEEMLLASPITFWET